MKTPSFTRVSVVGLCLVSIGVAVSLAQSAPGPTPQTPDLLGIYPGMLAAAARAQLQKRSSTTNVMNSSPPDGFSLSPDPTNREMISVYLTLPPNDQAVWMIQRTETFTTQNPMSQNALMTALREKYGKETLTTDRGGGQLVYWIYEQNGKLLSSADMDLTGCMGLNFFNFVRIGPPRQMSPLEQTCFRSFFAVTATLNRGGPGLLASYNVELVNLPYAWKAATATGNANNAAADQSRRNQIEKGDQNKPKF